MRRAFSTTLASQHLAVEPYRLSRGCVGRKDVSGALWGSEGFVYQCVARAQALCHLLVRICLAPAVSRPGRPALMEVVTA